MSFLAFCAGTAVLPIFVRRQAHPRRCSIPKPAGGGQRICEAQTGLNFAGSLPELFAGKEMGEDALRVLRDCLKIRARILVEIATELPVRSKYSSEGNQRWGRGYQWECNLKRAAVRSPSTTATK